MTASGEPVDLDAIEARAKAAAAMLPLDRGAIRKACQTATAGPWHQWCSPWFDVDEGVNAFSEDPHVGHVVADCGADYADPREEQISAWQRSANARFIAAARSWVPALLARLEQVEAAASALLAADGSSGRHQEAEERLRAVLGVQGREAGRG